MPLSKGTRFRYRKLGKKRRQRLAFKNNKVVEVSGYKKRNGKWVKKYTRRLPK